ncbi:ankyrin repeat and fibronectin type-III domain-containing protein 1-like [Paramormyrops kingsleyae]|uniref:ankyrin repeat and fibronectin type-III domain-containing protein 1-like n=1 Tax=Paramormyrops kingsleyae TaxID=1676925 RepID=UPI003B979AF3
MSMRKPPLRRRSLGSVSPKRLYRNLSVKLRGSETPAEHERSKHHHKPLHSYYSLWEAVENEDTLAVKSMLSKVKEEGRERKKEGKEQKREGESEEWGVNDVNEEGLVPLDVAILTQNSLLLRMLIKAGARHNPHLYSPPEWAAKLNTLVELAGAKQGEWKGLMLERPGAQEQASAQQQLRIWTLRRQLYCRMRDSFHRTVLPGPPSSVSLQVTGAGSLAVSFKEAIGNATGLVSCFKVEWSTSAAFQSICGSDLVMATSSLAYIITGLEPGTSYFVRVSACNMKGWGPAQGSKPASAAPSSWRECSGVRQRARSQAVEVKRLLEQIREPQYGGYCTEASRRPRTSMRQSLSRSLKQLFHSATKFVSLLQRGVYLAAVFYHKEKILLTSNNQLPLLEIQSCPTSVTQDFLWFAKLSCAWQQVPCLQQALSSSLSSSSSLLQSRRNILQAVTQLQSSLGTEDLGQVYYEPLKDNHGNVLLVTFKECLPEAQCPEHLLHWASLSCLDRSRPMLTPTPTAMEVLTEHLKEKLLHHRQSIQRANPGLYVGVLKLRSLVEQIRVLVSQKLPNLLCHARVRHNAHVSREEWAWLQSLSVIGDDGRGQSISANQEPARLEVTVPGDFVKSLRVAITQLLNKLCIPLHRAHEYRIYTQELLQFGEGISMLLLLPPSEEFSATPRLPEDSQKPGLTLPLQIFELVHFWTYEKEFLSEYCQAWVRLELDGHLSQQALREALDSKEIEEAKDRLSHITRLSQSLDATWREMRWITDAMQCVRSKHSLGMVPLASVMRGELRVQPAVQHEACNMEGTCHPRLATSESRREHQSSGPVPVEGAGAVQETASGEDGITEKPEEVYLADSGRQPYRALQTQGRTQSAVHNGACQSPLSTDGCRSPFAAQSDAALQLEANKNGGMTDTYDGLGLGNNMGDVSYRLGESGLQEHRCQPKSGHSKDASRYIDYYHQSVIKMSEHQAPGDEPNPREIPEFGEDGGIWDCFGDLASRSDPGDFLLDEVTPRKKLPARSLVEWVSTCTPQS